MQQIQPLIIQSADTQNRHACLLIGSQYISVYFVRAGQVDFIQTKQRLDTCGIQTDQQPVQQQKIRLRMLHGQNYHTLIHIGDLRADQVIAARQKLFHHTLILGERLKQHIITCQQPKRLFFQLLLQTAAQAAGIRPIL